MHAPPMPRDLQSPFHGTPLHVDSKTNTHTAARIYASARTVRGPTCSVYSARVSNTFGRSSPSPVIDSGSERANCASRDTH